MVLVFVTLQMIHRFLQELQLCLVGLCSSERKASSALCNQSIQTICKWLACLEVRAMR